MSHPTSSPEIPTRQSSILGYVPALDGLRALAVLAVLFYHADLLWLPGGFLGVEIFFVVSGYLITSLLLAEYRARNAVNLKQFWQRRARRLLPGLFAMLIAVMTYAVIFLPGEVASLRGDILAAFTYVTNWYLIAAQKSYFETMGRPSLLRHLWSLAVEEQFYLVLPLVFTFLLVRLKTRTTMLLLFAGAALSALWMGILFQPDTDPSRIYYGTDTRAAGLLLGAALAFVWTPLSQRTTSKAARSKKTTKTTRTNKQSQARAKHKLNFKGKRVRPKAETARRWLLDGVGIVALGGLVFSCLALTEFDPFLYQGGLLLVSVATVFVIAAVAAPDSPLLAPLLGNRVLRWIGLRSYSLYLWHWPVFMVTRPQLDTTLEGLPLMALRLAATFALAEISYHFIETPVRKGALGKLWDGWKNLQGARRWSFGMGGGALVLLALGGLFVLGSAIVNAQVTVAPDYVQMTAEDESVSGQQMTSATQGTLSPQATPATEETNPGSDMSSISYVIPAEAEPAPAVPLQGISPFALDSWLRARIDQSAPLVTTYSEQENWRLGRVTTHPNDTANSSNCGEECLARQEFADMKEGIVRVAEPALPGARVTAVAQTTTKTGIALPAIAPRRGPAPIFAIGDSVMLGAANYFRKAGLDVDVDAKLGRQVWTAIQILQQRKQANELAPTVIVHLGNNGTFSAREFDQMMAVLANVPHVIFVNNKVPRNWQVPNNDALSQGVKRYPNTILVDWNSASSAHAEWFWNDGIHLRPEGALIYTNLIAQYVVSANP